MTSRTPAPGKLFSLLSGIALFFLTIALMPIPYGIDNPEPIGAYLNGVFPSQEPANYDGIPALLSQTGAFSDLTTMTPAQGLIPYDLLQPFWSDGAQKFRWIAIPNDGTHDTPAEQVIYSEEGEWTFPPGTVAVKHFELPTDHANPEKSRRLETRFIIISEDGSMYGLTYRWNDDETDAELLETGLIESIAVRTPRGIEIRQWEYPGRETCLECHTPAAGRIIGPRSRQLNGDIYYPQTNQTANQLATWNHLGIFSEPLDENQLPDLLTSASRDNPETSLEHSALSYLDSNCGYCHRPGGVFTSQFDARLAIPLENSAIINGFAFNNLGIPNSAIVIPGDTSTSLIYQRMREIGNQDAMPPVAKNRVDSLGLKLISDWILSLGGSTAAEPNEKPATSSLVLSNHPNPFNSKTTVTFNLPHASHIQLDLFDAGGTRLRRLTNAFMPQGNHEIELDLDDFASGTYYLHLLTNGITRTTRAITLVKQSP